MTYIAPTPSSPYSRISPALYQSDASPERPNCPLRRYSLTGPVSPYEHTSHLAPLRKPDVAAAHSSSLQRFQEQAIPNREHTRTPVLHIDTRNIQCARTNCIERGRPHTHTPSLETIPRCPNLPRLSSLDQAQFELQTMTQEQNDRSPHSEYSFSSIPTPNLPISPKYSDTPRLPTSESSRPSLSFSIGSLLSPESTTGITPRSVESASGTRVRRCSSIFGLHNSLHTDALPYHCRIQDQRDSLHDAAHSLLGLKSDSNPVMAPRAAERPTQIPVLPSQNQGTRTGSNQSLADTRRSPQSIPSSFHAPSYSTSINSILRDNITPQTQWGYGVHGSYTSGASPSEGQPAFFPHQRQYMGAPSPRDHGHTQHPSSLSAREYPYSQRLPCQSSTTQSGMLSGAGLYELPPRASEPRSSYGSQFNPMATSASSPSSVYVPYGSSTSRHSHHAPTAYDTVRPTSYLTRESSVNTYGPYTNPPCRSANEADTMRTIQSRATSTISEPSVVPRTRKKRTSDIEHHRPKRPRHRPSTPSAPQHGTLVFGHDYENLSTGNVSSGVRQIPIQNMRALQVDLSRRDGSCCIVEDGRRCGASDNLRSAVSHFFGRNKNGSKLLKELSEMPICRKHYQRRKYDADKNGAYHTTQYNYLQYYLYYIQQRVPEYTWKISYSKSLGEQVHILRRSRMTNTDPPPIPDSDKEAQKTRQQAVMFLDNPHLDRAMNSSRASYEELLEFLKDLYDATDRDKNDKQKSLPRVEFLPEDPKSSKS